MHMAEHTALGLNLAGGMDAILGCVVCLERDFQRIDVVFCALHGSFSSHLHGDDGS